MNSPKPQKTTTKTTSSPHPSKDPFAPLKPDCSEQDYRKHPALGSTDIKSMIQNAKKFYMVKTGQLKKSSPALRFGQAFHVALLEPEKFDDAVWVTDINVERLMPVVERDNYLVSEMKTKTAKKFIELQEQNPDKDIVTLTDGDMIGYIKQNLGKTVISKADAQLVQELCEKVKAMPNMSKYLEGGKKEQAYFGMIDGVHVKCRLDLIYPIDKDGKNVIIIDPKSTAKENISEEFAKSSGNNCYFIQEALYREILKQNGFNVVDYLFIQVSREEYCGASYYKHEHTALEFGMDEIKYALNKFKYCKENNTWREDQFDPINQTFEDVNIISLPNYVYYRGANR